MKDENSKEKLKSISIRGDRKLWEEFLFVVDIKKEKNVWAVLSRLIKNYLRGGE